MRDLETDIVASLGSSRRYVPRAELAKACGVSGREVARVVGNLRTKGYRIDEVPGEGYRLLFTPDLLGGLEVKTALRGLSLAREVHALGRVESTNDVALGLAARGAPEGTLVVAEEQTGGRGRLGRRWLSPPGLGLWFSLVLRPNMKVAESVLIPLAAALGIATALRQEWGVKAGIRWPNDVVVGEKKICGLLCDGGFIGSRVESVVLGVGLNVLHDKHDFPADLRNKATSLRLETGRDLKRLEVFAGVVRAIEATYSSLCSRGFASIRRELLALSPLVGRVTKVITGDSELEGVVVDIADDGALVLRLETGQLRRVLAGDVVRVT